MKFASDKVITHTSVGDVGGAGQKKINKEVEEKMRTLGKE